MNPKISGFSLARNPEDDQSDLTTCVAGTMGYIAPRYFLTGRISAKLDVYSFGVVILETMTGKRSIETKLGGVYTLAPYAWKLWNVTDLIGKSLGGEFLEEEALRCIQVGLLCSQLEPQQCPTMAFALKMLLGEDSSLQEKLALAQCPFRIEPESGESDDAPNWATDWPDYDSFNPRT